VRRAGRGVERGGLPELVAHGEGGFVFPVGDTGAMAGCVIALLSDPRELAGRKSWRVPGPSRTSPWPRWWTDTRISTGDFLTGETV